MAKSTPKSVSNNIEQLFLLLCRHRYYSDLIAELTSETLDANESGDLATAMRNIGLVDGYLADSRENDKEISLQDRKVIRTLDRLPPGPEKSRLDQEHDAVWDFHELAMAPLRERNQRNWERNEHFHQVCLMRDEVRANPEISYTESWWEAE